MNKKTKIIHFTLFTLIIIFGIILRIYNINNIPSGIYPDEANNGTNAYDAQINNAYQWFYPDNNGREGLYINLMAIIFKLFGISIFTIKLPSIIMGTLTIFGVYLLSRELFISKPKIALITSYLTAVGFWAVNFSRIAFRAITMLPILTFSFYFIFKGLRTNKWWQFAIAGFIFGLGFHTYIAFRIAPVLLFVLFFLLIFQQGFQILKKHWKNIIIFILFVLFSAFPIFYTLHIHPEFTNSRTNELSIFANNQQNISKTLQDNIKKSLLKFNITGDQNWRHGYPPLPTLEFFVGLMFIGGIFLSIFIFLKYIVLRFTKKVRNRKLVTHGLLLAWFVIFLAPEFLTTEGLPHALRSIGTLPVVYIFSAFFIDFLIEYSKKLPYKIHIVTFTLIIALLGISGFCNIIKYNIFWAKNSHQAQSFDKSITDIAYYIKTLPTQTTKYIIAGPLKRLPIQLLNEDTPNLFFLYENEINTIDTKQDFYILTTKQNDYLINNLTRKIKMIITVVKTDLNTQFIIARHIK